VFNLLIYILYIDKNCIKTVVLNKKNKGDKMNKIFTAIGAGVIALLIVAIVALLGGVFVMLLWNWLMPMLFHLPAIDFWQGWGISCLCGLLFKGTTTVNNKD
jgi:hypothetical protein